MVWEKFTCSSPTNTLSEGGNGELKAGTPYVRLVLNAAPISLVPVCGDHKAENAYGACAFADFIKAPVVQLALSNATGAWGSPAWNATCGGV